MVPQIADLVRRCVYQGKMEDAASTAVKLNATAIKFQSFLAGRYDVREKSWIFLNVTDGQNDIVGTSKVNPANLKVGHNIISDLIEDGFQNILYITPYKAQQQEIARIIDAMGLPEDTIRASTVDGAQGTEADIVVFDLVSAATKARNANFVRSYNRLNVGLTRAKYGLVFIGSKDPAERLLDTSKAKRNQLYDYIVAAAIIRGVFHSLASGDCKSKRQFPENRNRVGDGAASAVVTTLADGSTSVDPASAPSPIPAPVPAPAPAPAPAQHIYDEVDEANINLAESMLKLAEAEAHLARVRLDVATRRAARAAQQ